MKKRKGKSDILTITITLCQAVLVLEWVTACKQVNHLGM